MAMTSRHSPQRIRRGDAETGIVMFALLAAVIPLLLMVAAASSTMISRNKGLLYDIKRSGAMLAADTGVDEALWRSANGTLVSGTPFTRTIRANQRFTVVPLFLGGDGVDNDGDTLVDEADEDIYQLTITATYVNARRRIVAYLGAALALPPLESGVAMTSVAAEIRLDDDPLLTGQDTNMDGTPGPGPDLPGLAITPPGTVPDLITELDAFEMSRIQGNSPSPSLAENSGPIDLAGLALAVQNTANIVLVSDDYTAVNWGDGPSNDLNVVYRNGDLRVADSSQGAGVLLVTGSLRIQDGFRWDGLIIVLGDEFRTGDDMEIYGGLIFGGNARIFMQDDSKIRYSTEAMNLISTLLPASQYIIFNGWHEISLY